MSPVSRVWASTPHGNVVTPVVLLVICLIESALAAINGDPDTPRRRDGLGTPLPRLELQREVC